MIEEDIVARLGANADVAAAFGVNIFPVSAPPDQPPPYLIYRRIDTDTDDAFGDTSVHAIPFVFESHVASYTDAVRNAALLRPALHGWRENPPHILVSLTYAGEHDGAGDYDEEKRRRRTHCRELLFAASIRA